MKICGITPLANIAGQPLQFVLRSRDALAWLTLEKLEEQQRRQWLTDCPEALLWSLAHCEESGAVTSSDLIGLIIDSPESFDGSTTTARPLVEARS